MIGLWNALAACADRNGPEQVFVEQLVDDSLEVRPTVTLRDRRRATVRDVALGPAEATAEDVADERVQRRRVVRREDGRDGRRDERVRLRSRGRRDDIFGGELLLLEEIPSDDDDSQDPLVRVLMR